MRIAGTTVSIIPNPLRVPVGASGVMFQVSGCGGPPHRKRLMQALALPDQRIGLSSTRSNCGSVNPMVPCAQADYSIAAMREHNQTQSILSC
jgi:hypothetical protein